MALKDGKIKFANRLWKARKRRGLGQKQVAFLIGKTIGEVSRYERGVRLPELQTILALEIAYGVPLRVLYEDLYEQVRTEMRQRIETSANTETIYADLLARVNREATQYCAYEEAVSTATASFPERGQVRDHITRLAKNLAGL